MTPEIFAALSATGIADGVRSGTLRPTDVIAAALARLDEVDPHLHAFTFINTVGAMQAAAVLEAKIAQGHRPGPLAGVPVAVKDLILTKDMPTCFGSRLYAGYQPDRDDIVVERLRAADAILIGKTNCSEFGYGGVGHNPLFPTTRNPWNPALTPGGSSAGSAVAVVTGICPLALGSDGGGSIRLPAAFTGLVGVKASMGRVPLWPGCRDASLPGVSSWESIEHIGPLARNVEDAALMLSVIAGPDPRDRLSIPSADVDWTAAAAAQVPAGLRIAWCSHWGGQPVDPQVSLHSRRHADRLAKAIGATLKDVPAPHFPLDLFRKVVAQDTDMDGLTALRAAKAEPVSPALAMLLDDPGPASSPGRDRMAAVAGMADLMATCDLLLTPTTACLPFPVDLDGPKQIDGQPVADDAWTPAAFPMNLTGQPAASVPAGLSVEGLPIGLQIVGRHLDDALVLATVAAALKLVPARLIHTKFQHPQADPDGGR